MRSPDGVLDGALFDDLILSFVRWKQLCLVSQDAYDRWCACAPSERADAYAAFCVAQGDEERAAARYQQVVDRIERMPIAR